MLTFGSLFAGIGGFDLGFERAGFQCKWQVEIDDYATKILERHWPEVHRERDIRQCGRHNLERVDCIIGGFPCQDISYAGKGAGLDGARSGLFFEAIRLVCELRPRAVVLENVAGLLTRGLDRVLGTLAEVGFDAEWHCIPAAAVGAPHIRDRVFVLAYAKGERHGLGREREHVCKPKRGQNRQMQPELASSSERGQRADVAYTRRKHGNRRPSIEEQANRQEAERDQAVDNAERCGEVECDSDTNSRRQQERSEQDSSAKGWKQPSQRNCACGLCKDVADAKKHGRHKGKPDRRRVQAGIGAGQEYGLRDGGEVVSDTDSDGREGRGQDGQPSRPLGLRSGAGGNKIERVRLASADWWAIEPAVGELADGVSGGLVRFAGRVATGIPNRVHKLRCLGNAIVPQVAEVVARMAMDRLTGGNDGW
jgi:DNA-cytosine methyltransferase